MSAAAPAMSRAVHAGENENSLVVNACEKSAPAGNAAYRFTDHRKLSASKTVKLTLPSRIFIRHRAVWIVVDKVAAG